jgi:murein DD-endopeptidase MepM/ murein hydrolase activator NlpD
LQTGARVAAGDLVGLMGSSGLDSFQMLSGKPEEED